MSTVRSTPRPRPRPVAAAPLLLLVGALPALGPPSAAAQTRLDAETLPTRAEATDWIETSRYDDVLGFLRVVADASPRAHLTTMGYTHEGRAIPMLVLGDVEDASPDAVRGSGKLRVYLQGNIHGGEVPGKEALLMLVREIVSGDDRGWLDDMVLLVTPLYNADGNEAVALTNRPRQHGPLGGMGRRPNAQGYDLNRDHMKLDAPEARSVVSMMNAYDPHLSVDLHTTNGTRHAYHLTYAPPLHPGTHPALLELLRGEMLPALSERAVEDHGIRFYYYGNAYDGSEGMGWYTFDHRPRFNNNYIGLRNRLAILSEAYAYLTFRDRVMATRWFVEDILDYAGANAPALRDAVEAADAGRVSGRTLPTRAASARSDTMVTIWMGEVAEERNPWSGQVILRRLDEERPVEMWELGTFQATDTEVAPAAYLVPPELADVLERLGVHGAEAAPTTEEGTRSVEVFALDSVQTAGREFQGHRERTLFGRWEPATRAIPAGTVEVPVDQPLGRLVFYLLEPRSDDGFASWGLLDDALEGAEEYPILRVPVDGP